MHPGFHLGKVHTGVLALDLLLLWVPAAASWVPHPRTLALLPPEFPPIVHALSLRPNEKFVFVYFNN